jgi:hypothetical protein
VFGTLVAARLYAEPFDFWTDPFSALGGARTMGGMANTAGMIAFMVTLGVSGVALLGLYRTQGIRHEQRPVSTRNEGRPGTWSNDDVGVADTGEAPEFLRALLAVGGVGYWIAAVPYDVVHFAHSLGSGLAVASLYGWSIFFLIDLSQELRHRVVALMHGALHWSVLAYAILFAAGQPEKQGVQKLAFLMIVFVLLTAAVVDRRESDRESSSPTTDRRRNHVLVDARGGEPRINSVAEREGVDYSDTTED